jgi:O-antigen/teichoic acid export membrane protein
VSLILFDGKLKNWITDNFQNPLFKNSYYILSNSILTASLGFIFWIVVTKYYTPANIGYSVALISLIGIVTQVARFGVDVAVIRYFNDTKDVSTLINSCFLFIGLSTLIIATIFLLIIKIFVIKLDIVMDSAVYVLGFLFFSLVSALFLIQTNIFIASRNSKYLLYQSIIASGLSILLVIIFNFFLMPFGVFYSWGLSTFFAFIFCLIFFFKKAIPDYRPLLKIEWELIKEIFPYSFGNYFVNLISALPPLLFPLIIVAYLLPDDSAYFYISFSIANIMFMIPGAISTSLFAEGSHNAESFSINVKKAIKNTYFLLIPTVILVILFGNQILLLFGKNYSVNGHVLLSLLAISSLFITLNSFYYTYLRIQFKIKELLALTIFSSISILTISSIFLHFLKIGISSVGLAYIIVNLVIAVYVAIRWKKMHITTG